MRRERGWTQRQLAREAGCSWGMIDMLENMTDCVTHPEIADGICRALGASDEQYRSIIPGIRRNEPRPERKPAPQEHKPPDSAQGPPVNTARRPVVAISPEGKEVERYESVIAAADAYDVNECCIRDRCLGRIRRGEYRFMGVSFRYANEFDMNQKG